MAVRGPCGDGWTVVLRRQPVRMVEGGAEGGYTDVFQLICCDCGDDPGLDYREVAPGFGWSAGPTRSRTVSPPTSSTAGGTSSPG